jgi:hypothetical protein
MLDKRVEEITPPAKPPDDREVYASIRAAEAMTKSEKFSFIRAIKALVKEDPTGTMQPTEAWLLTRAVDEQAAVRKYLTLLEQFKGEKP